MITRLIALFCSTVFVLGLLGSTTAHAVVNLKNGNFYIAYDDLVVDEHSSLKLSRHYNSLSDSRGWFGWGWGTEFETRLFVMPDGLVAVRENGNAHVTLYGEPDEPAVIRASDRIIEALRTTGKLKASQESALRKQLQEDHLFRLQWAERLGLTGKLPDVGKRLNDAEFESNMDRFAETSDAQLLAHAVVSGDTNLSLLRLKHTYIADKTDMCGQLLRTNDGFERGTCSDQRFGDRQSFDQQGRLTKLNIKGNWLRLAYGKSRFPERIIDESGKHIALAWNDKGLISQISGLANGKQRVIDYTYDQDGNLIKSDEHTANVYKYEYDGAHHMTAILYGDLTKKLLEYDANGRVSKIMQREGEKAFFRYESNDRGDIEIVYLKQSAGEPREMRRLRYNSKGMLLLDRDPESTEQYEYHPVFGKITRYRDGQLDCQYEYNDQARLSQENCSSHGFINFIDYDSAGKIVKLTLTVPPELKEKVSDKYVVTNMQYDRLGRVVRVTEPSGGAQLIKNYANDNDREGWVQTQIGMEDPVAKKRFQAATALQEFVLRGISQRTRINTGFVMVRE